MILRFTFQLSWFFQSKNLLPLVELKAGEFSAGEFFGGNFPVSKCPPVMENNSLRCLSFLGHFLNFFVESITVKNNLNKMFKILKKNKIN